LVDAQNQLVGGSFTTNSAGRAVAPDELTIGETYTLQETASQLVQSVELTQVTFQMDKARKELLIVNKVTQPNMPYAG
jgi:hypothetical protein